MEVSGEFHRSGNLRSGGAYYGVMCPLRLTVAHVDVTTREGDSLMHRTTSLILAVCLLTLVSAAHAGDSALIKAVDEYLQPIVDDSLISGSVLIARGDRVLLSRGYGLANREHGVLCTPQTVYRLGSITKQFTAMAVMILAERGALAISDTLSKYYPDFPDASKITLHQLLTHTSGIINSSTIEDYGEEMMMPRSVEEVIAWIAEQPLVTEPGSRWIYSNSGYIILAGIIEQVTGKTYAEFLTEAIFDPLGMTATGQDVFTDVIPHRATGHVNLGDRLPIGGNRHVG
jgi:CubicO group peptidase (beta-lactamase class C family)